MSHPYSKQPRDAHEVCGTEAISAIAATGQPAEVVTHDSCKQRTLSRHMSGHQIVLTLSPIHLARYNIELRQEPCASSPTWSWFCLAVTHPIRLAIFAGIAGTMPVAQSLTAAGPPACAS